MKIINKNSKKIRYYKIMLQLVPTSRIVKLLSWEYWEKCYLGVTLVVNDR